MRKYRSLSILSLLFVTLLAVTRVLAEAQLHEPRPGAISTKTAKQIVKEATASAYLFENKNDFDRDGVDEIFVGANCKEGFCTNYIFRQLHNDRVQYLGKAVFHHQYYELVWDKKIKMADIVYFRQENVGQGCLGRHVYSVNKGYRQEFEICRLPKEVMNALNSYSGEKQLPVQGRSNDKGKDLDYIDMSDIEFNDSPEDLFPPPEEE